MAHSWERRRPLEQMSTDARHARRSSAGLGGQRARQNGAQDLHGDMIAAWRRKGQRKGNWCESDGWFEPLTATVIRVQARIQRALGRFH